MARDFHGDNAKIAIEPILTSNRREQRLQGRGLPCLLLCSGRPETFFGVRCFRILPFNVDV